MNPSIYATTSDALQSHMAAWGERPYRSAQVLDWVYRKRAAAWDEMSNLPKALRARLAEAFECRLPELIRRQGASDTTQKFLWRLRDGALIESVLIPANPALYGEASDRHTLCLSSQVGCAYGCAFCASGLEGWKRHLTPDEIVGQLLAVERLHASTERASDRMVQNVVMMGMGEPLANYDNVLRSLEILNAPWGGHIGARKITLSTSGLAPQIRRLAETPYQFRLAISLHGASDEVRSRIMPVNRKYPITELMAACADYVATKGHMITFEYILIGGVNDGLDQVPRLAQWAQKLHAKINLIPYNTVDGLPWVRPELSSQEAFLSELRRTGVPVTLRREKGHDIDAACGQLRLRELQEG